MRLADKTAIVTGAASGIGQATAAALEVAGATVVGADLAGDPPVDVSRRAEVDALVGGVVADHGHLDVMANCAGIMVTDEVVDLREDDLDRVLAVNVKGVVFGTQAALRVMASGSGGSIVNLASSGIDLPAPGLAAYAMSKAAVAMFTRTAAVEAGRHGVRVNAVAPGYVDTEMTRGRFRRDDGSLDEDAREGYLRMMRGVSPLGRTGEPGDVAQMVVFLASDAARFVTGQILRPNGGVTMPW